MKLALRFAIDYTALLKPPSSTMAKRSRADVDGDSDDENHSKRVKSSTPDRLSRLSDELLVKVLSCLAIPQLVVCQRYVCFLFRSFSAIVLNIQPISQIPEACERQPDMEEPLLQTLRAATSQSFTEFERGWNHSRESELCLKVVEMVG